MIAKVGDWNIPSTPTDAVAPWGKSTSVVGGGRFDNLQANPRTAIDAMAGDRIIEAKTALTPPKVEAPHVEPLAPKQAAHHTVPRQTAAHAEVNAAKQVGNTQAKVVPPATPPRGQTPHAEARGPKQSAHHTIPKEANATKQAVNAEANAAKNVVTTVEKEGAKVAKNSWKLGKKGKIIAGVAIGAAALAGGAVMLSARRQRFAEAQAARKRDDDLPPYSNGDDDILAPLLRDGPLGPSYKGPGKG